MSQFEEIIAGCYQNATGRPFTDDIRVEAENALPLTIGDYANSAIPIPDIAVGTVEAPLYLIEHTDKEDFTPDQLRMISQIWWLGKIVIESMQDSISKNPLLSERVKDVEDVFDVFSAKVWYMAHPEVTAEEMRDYSKASLINPENLETWPKGGRLNCLGVAIAMIAMFRTLKIDAEFATEIRLSEDDISRHFWKFRLQLMELFPDLLADPYYKKIYEQYIKGYNDETRADLVDNVFEIAPILSGRSEPTAFHHYVLVPEYFEDQNYWVQIDPWGFTLRETMMDYEQFMVARRLLSDPRFVSDVFVVDNSFPVTDGLQYIDRTMREVAKSRGILEDLLNNADYRKYGYFDNLKSIISKYVFENFYGHYDGLEDESELRELVESYVLGLWPMFIAEFVIETNVEPPGDKDDRGLIAEWYERASAELRARIKYDSSLRSKIIRRLINIPAIMLVLKYNMIANRHFCLRSVGTADSASEVGNTNFAVGLAYMNHFALSRESGNINIAPELAQVAASQITWANASAEGGEDLSSLGELYKSLPRELRHPFLEREELADG